MQRFLPALHSVKGDWAFFDWMMAEEPWPPVFCERPSPVCGVQSVGAQLRAAALIRGSCLFQVNEPENSVIEIPTVKWKEGGLLVGAITFSRDRRVINRRLRILERLLQTRALIDVHSRLTEVYLSF